MKAKRILKKVFLVFSLILLSGSSAFAIPTLQLDITRGTYNTGDETIYAQSNPFTLVALLNDPAFLGDTFYISAALMPQTAVGEDLGSFTFSGATVEVTGDMTYGTPPIETVLTSDPHDLQSHGIFDTYFAEFAFTFPANKTIAYNSMDNPGGISPDILGTMYYALFVVDTSLLAYGYNIHFDLYSKTTDQDGNVVIGINAPFSHDANTNHAPIPAAAWLLGSGLLGLVAVRRRYTRK